MGFFNGDNKDTKLDYINSKILGLNFASGGYNYKMNLFLNSQNISTTSKVRAKIDFDLKKVSYFVDDIEVASGDNLTLLDPNLKNIKFGIFNF